MKLLALLFIVPAICFANPFFENEKLDAPRGKSVDFGKGPVLVVNIATQCGYTPQLEALEKLNQQYKDKGLTIVGVPSNDFGGQTPESDEEVAKFCKLNYGATFQISKKKTVIGGDKNQLIAKLIKASKNEKEIKWNFEKFLISKDGTVVQRFSSNVAPDSKDFINKIDASLK